MTERSGELSLSEIVEGVQSDAEAWAFAVSDMEGKLEQSSGDHYAPDKTSFDVVSALHKLKRSGEISSAEYRSRLEFWTPILDTLKIAYQTPHMWTAVKRGEVFDGGSQDVYVDPARSERAADLMVRSGLIPQAEAA